MKVGNVIKRVVVSFLGHWEILLSTSKESKQDELWQRKQQIGKMATRFGISKRDESFAGVLEGRCKVE